MSFSIGSLISPKAGMTIVKNAIEKTIKQPVNNFDIIYKHEAKVIDFRLYEYTDKEGVFNETKVVKYADGSKLCNIIHNMIKDKLTTGETIDVAIINYKFLTCKLLITKEGIKKTKNYNL